MSDENLSPRVTSSLTISDTLFCCCCCNPLKSRNKFRWTRQLYTQIKTKTSPVDFYGRGCGVPVFSTKKKIFGNYRLCIRCHWLNVSSKSIFVLRFNTMVNRCIIALISPLLNKTPSLSIEQFWLLLAHRSTQNNALLCMIGNGVQSITFRKVPQNWKLEIHIFLLLFLSTVYIHWHCFENSYA